jgi:hypothetical protein
LQWQLALDARARLRARLLARGADPQYRARVAAAATAERARLAAIADAQAVADLNRWQADQVIIDRRVQIVIDARASLVAQLTDRGAHARPPMPINVEEMPGEPPLPGYAWVDGEWHWTAGEWRWTRGYWLGADTGGTVSAATSTAAGVAAALGGITVTVGVGAGTPPAPPPPRSRDQDHR